MIYYIRDEEGATATVYRILLEMDLFRVSGDKLSWDEAVDIYIAVKQSETASNRTVQYEKENLNCYKRIMVEQEIAPSVEDITIEGLRKHFVLYWWRRKGTHTINNRIKTLKRFFLFLHREGWIYKNPTALLKTHSGQQPPIYSFTEKEITMLFDKMNKNTFTGYRDYSMLFLMLDTGIRLGEIVKLKVHQVDFKQCFLLGVFGKSRRPRDVPFCDEFAK